MGGKSSKNKNNINYIVDQKILNAIGGKKRVWGIRRAGSVAAACSTEAGSQVRPRCTGKTWRRLGRQPVGVRKVSPRELVKRLWESHLLDKDEDLQGGQYGKTTEDEARGKTEVLPQTELPNDSATPLLGIYLEKTKPLSQKDTYTTMFINRWMHK